MKEKTGKRRKLGGGERQGEGAQGPRREAVCFQTISYIVKVCSAEGTTL